MPWQDLDIPVDEAAITTNILTRLAEALPDWTPSEGAPEVALAEEFGHQVAIVNQAAVAAARYAAAGVATAFGFEPVGGARATLAGVNLVAQLPPSASAAPFTTAVTVPAGFAISVDQRAFTVPTQVTVAVDFTEVTTGPYAGYWRGAFGIDFTALEVGASSNIGDVDQAATLQTVSPVIVSATLTVGAAGGIDPESMTAFLSRFTSWLRTLKPGGVRAQNIADFAGTVLGVQRAIALDRYDALDPGTVAERTVTVIPVDAAGQPLDVGTRARLQAELEQIREVGFIFRIADPEYATPTIVISVAKGDEHTAAEVQANVVAVLAAALHPSRWGTVNDDPRTWTERGTLRILDLAVLASTAVGVAAVLSVTIDGGTTDVVLNGGDPGALIAPVGVGGTTVTVTVP